MKIQFNKIFVGAFHVLAGVLVSHHFALHATAAYVFAALSSLVGYVIHNPPPEAVKGEVQDTLSKIGAAVSIMLLMAWAVFSTTGCAQRLAAGGAYSGQTLATNGAVISTNTVAAADPALFAADSAYQFAYEIVDGIFAQEYQNRAAYLAISPKIKQALDAARPVVLDIDRRWAAARQAYKANPTPAGLTTLQSILAEIQKLLPTIQAAIAPVTTSTSTNSVTQ